MNYKITKLDRRHNGYNFYKYSISPAASTRIENFDLLIELRNWCWATYGPSAEIGLTKKGSVWAWDTEHGHRRIYLQSDAELTMFKLKFS